MKLLCRIFGHAWWWETTAVDRLSVDGELAASAWYRCDRCGRCSAQRCLPLDSLFAVPREPSRRELVG